jgi:hypothetical protein
VVINCRRLSFLLALVFALSFSSTIFASTSTLTLAWDSSSDPEVNGYIVSYGTQSGAHPTRLDVGARTSQPISGLTDGVTYYFVVQAYDTQGQISASSQEVSSVAGLPSTAPLTLACPAPSATSYDGKPVVMSFSALINGGTQPVTAVCSPPSGTAFPVGTTAVSCVATDAVRRTASCSTTATVVLNNAPAPGPGRISPNCTRITPGQGTITTSDGATWSLSPTQQTLRDGTQVDGGWGSVMVITAGQIQVLGTDNRWYVFLGWWSATGAGDPCTSPAPVPPAPVPPAPVPPAPPAISPNCTSITPGHGSITTSDGASWSLSSTKQTLRNQAWADNGKGTVMEIAAGQIQVLGVDKRWYVYQGWWQATGAGDPCVSPASYIVSAQTTGAR